MLYGFFIAALIFAACVVAVLWWQGSKLESIRQPLGQIAAAFITVSGAIIASNWAWEAVQQQLGVQSRAANTALVDFYLRREASLRAVHTRSNLVYIESFSSTMSLLSDLEKAATSKTVLTNSDIGSVSQVLTKRVSEVESLDTLSDNTAFEVTGRSRIFAFGLCVRDAVLGVLQSAKSMQQEDRENARALEIRTAREKTAAKFESCRLVLVEALASIDKELRALIERRSVAEAALTK